MEEEKTTVVDSESIIKKDTKESLISICEDLEEHGYNPTKQIVAYLVSGDPGYISSYKECRTRILKYDREDIIEMMLVEFMK